MKKISFKKAIQVVFPAATDIKLSKGYYFCSGFFNVGDQVYYINTGDTRFKTTGTMYRTAKDRKDFTGGVNQFDFDSKLQEKGYVVDKIPQKTN